MTTDWRAHGVKIIPSNRLDTNTLQTPGMTRAAAINQAMAGAKKLWAGSVNIHPNAKTSPHHHGELESVIYIVSGRAHALGGTARVCCRGRPGGFYFRAAVRAAPGNQCQRR